MFYPESFYWFAWHHAPASAQERGEQKETVADRWGGEAGGKMVEIFKTGCASLEV